MKNYKEILNELLNESNLRSVKVTYDDGSVETTSMSAKLSDDDIKDYFKIGKKFNVGKNGKDKIAKVKEVEILK